MRRGQIVALVPPAPRFPFEVWFLAAHPQGGLPPAEPGLADDLATVYGHVLTALHARVVEFIPFNLYLHCAPVDRPASLPWHFELVPRHGVHAGMEIGLELPINPVTPEHAAAVLRGEG
jgi:UDPglucose--hexose-1-phosphate uridylyltransferase